MADAKAEALEEAADEWATRSETFLETMKNMVGNGYGHDDIIRYGAYSAEAQTTSARLRIKAAVERNQS
jgi:hypothetical protein